MNDIDKERTISEYVREYSLNHSTLSKAIRQGGKNSRLPARKLVSVPGVRGGVYLIKQSDFDLWYAHHQSLPRIQNKQKRENGQLKETSKLTIKSLDNSERSEYTIDS